MQFDQSPFLRGAISFQTDQGQSRRHDFREILRIAVEFEHLSRTGGEWGAGVKYREHDELVKFLDDYAAEAQATDSPAERAPGVRPH